MSRVAVAYVPVLHEGYRRFLTAHAAGLPLWVVGRSLFADHRPLAKDVRALDPAVARDALAALGICASVAVLEAGDEVAADEVVLPDEDVSRTVVERVFPRAAVWLAPVFLRWDRDRSVRLLEPSAPPVDGPDPELAALAHGAAADSTDWWRQVGAAIRFADGTVAAARNAHLPHDLAPYAVGDPRANFSRGVHLELSTAVHAEAGLIAAAARDGRATAGATLYVTDFPCPPCAKLIAGAGIARLYFQRGYAVLDGEDVLAAAGVEVRRVDPDRAVSPARGR